MDKLSDFELHRSDSERAPVPPPAHSPSVWVAVALFVVAVAGAAYVVFGLGPPPIAPQAVSKAATALQPPSRSLGGQPESISVPALDETDSVVRTLVLALSKKPAVVAWLATEGLIRNFVEVVANIADGRTPAKLLAPLHPVGRFRVIERDRHPDVDPRSYDRYAEIADAVGAIDPPGAARVYAALRPRIEQAYHELDGSPESFDQPLEEAIVTLLDTPVVEGSVRLRPKGIGYTYVDERLETLTNAQRQLLRMGPRNTQIIEKKLRAIGLALGISSARLSAG